MAMAQVYDSEAAALRRNAGESGPARPMRRLMWKTIKTASLLGLPILAMAAAAPWVFPLVFGADWAEAGAYAVPFGLMSYISFAFIPVGGTVDVLERQDLHLVREGVRLVLMAGALGSSVVLGMEPQSAMWLLAAAGSAGYLFYGLVSVYAIRTAATVARE
jgi:O-antigen/teichoic acid export membrane protein